MGGALRLAKQALSMDEVPVGCVIELGGNVIGEGFNQTVRRKDATAHAEIIALGSAGRNLGDFRLEGARLFVTLEPCLMCLGAIILARVAEVHYCIPDEKFGAFSRFNLRDHERIRKIKFHSVPPSGELAEEIQALMLAFFRKLRKDVEYD